MQAAIKMNDQKWLMTDDEKLIFSKPPEDVIYVEDEAAAAKILNEMEPFYRDDGLEVWEYRWGKIEKNLHAPSLAKDRIIKGPDDLHALLSRYYPRPRIVFSRSNLPFIKEFKHLMDVDCSAGRWTMSGPINIQFFGFIPLRILANRKKRAEKVKKYSRADFIAAGAYFKNLVLRNMSALRKSAKITKYELASVQYLPRRLDKNAIGVDAVRFFVCWSTLADRAKLGEKGNPHVVMFNRLARQDRAREILVRELCTHQILNLLYTCMLCS